MKNYLLVFISLGFMCAAISTPIHTMETNRIKNAFSLPIRFISNNLYPLAFWGTIGLIGAYATKTLMQYWHDRERTFEIDGLYNILIKRWVVDGAHEYIAVIKNKMTNESYGHLIYQLQPLNVVYIRRLVIDPEYRNHELGGKLLKAVLERLPSLYGCKKVTLLASPMELRDGETKEQMLPKLIKFYEKHGAKVARTENGHTWMVIDLTKQA